MTDIRQSENYANYLKSQRWVVERVNGVNYFIKKLPLVGSVLKIQRPKHLDIQTTIHLEHKYRVFQTIIEPTNLNEESRIINYGFRLSKSPYLPTKTLQIDLSESIDMICKKFKRNINKGIKMGENIKIKIYSSPNELEIFQKAWKKSVNFSRYVPSTQDLINLRKCFPNNNSLFLASHNITGNIIGGVIFTKVSHESVHYMYGFTSSEGRASLTHASLFYQGILWGKRVGCKIFDFEGIYDERFPNKSWLGFTHFKKQFGGVEILYPGCYTKWNLSNIFLRFR